MEVPMLSTFRDMRLELSTFLIYQRYSRYETWILAPFSWSPPAPSPTALCSIFWRRWTTKWNFYWGVVFQVGLFTFKWLLSPLHVLEWWIWNILEGDLWLRYWWFDNFVIKFLEFGMSYKTQFSSNHDPIAFLPKLFLRTI